MPRRLLPLLPLLLLAPAARGQDIAEFFDGFTLKGKHGKEVAPPAAIDSLFNSSFPCDYLNAGPRFIFFSNNAKKGIVMKKEPEVKQLEFNRPYQKGKTSPLPKGVPTRLTEFNADGRREILVENKPFPSETIVQIATAVNPRYVYVDSPTHTLRQVYATNEFTPAVLRGLIATHPDVKDGWIPAPDPIKRLKIAEFFLQAGMRVEAKAELAKTKKDIPGAWPKEAADKYDLIAAEVDKVDVRYVISELTVAVAAGQYELAAQVLEQYKPTAAGADDLKALADLKVKVGDLRGKVDAARKHLRTLIDRASGGAERHPHLAVGGAGVWAALPPKPVPAEVRPVVEGAEAVLAELHPDTVWRLKTFLEVADGMAKDIAAGREPKKKPQAALALAVSGWVGGGGGAETEDHILAGKMWNTRKMATAYLADANSLNRGKILRDWNQSSDVRPADELAQIVSLIPPIAPFDPNDKRVRDASKASGAVGTYRVESGPLPDDADGVTYFVRLPKEYHPGRAYPVVLALHNTGQDAAGMVGLLAAEADRRGYILAAPVWGSPFGNKTFDYAGGDHRLVTTCLRDLSRKFMVDQDRVFAWGYGEGGTFALDLSMSRPDQFAGVVSFAANMPVPRFYREYAKNAQKLAVYSVTGEMSPAVNGLRELYQNWLPFGYYAILSVYKGRGAEWYGGEVPTIFDWMEPKRRQRGLKSLRMDGGVFDAWHTFREADDRFYWVGASEILKGNLADAKRPDNPKPAARFSADIIKGDQIVVKDVYGMKKITLWLERDMIDWDKPVYFNVANPTGLAKKTEVKRDVPLMLEELYRTGDRKMLFFGKFEFKL